MSGVVKNARLDQDHAGQRNPYGDQIALCEDQVGPQCPGQQIEQREYDEVQNQSGEGALREPLGQ